MSEETPIQNMAPGLLQAFAPQEEAMKTALVVAAVARMILANLRKWEPLYPPWPAVMAGEIITYEQALASGLPIREVQDALMPGLEDEVIKVNMVQRMTDSGRRVRFNVMACVGNKDGYVGLGMAKAKEVPKAIEKAITAAKLNLIARPARATVRGNLRPDPATPSLQGQRACCLHPCLPHARRQGQGLGHR